LVTLRQKCKNFGHHHALFKLINRLRPAIAVQINLLYFTQKRHTVLGINNQGGAKIVREGTKSCAKLTSNQLANAPTSTNARISLNQSNFTYAIQRKTNNFNHFLLSRPEGTVHQNLHFSQFKFLFIQFNFSFTFFLLGFSIFLPIIIVYMYFPWECLFRFFSFPPSPTSLFLFSDLYMSKKDVSNGIRIASEKHLITHK
jgi:hypothetical protein